jgi:hypothetical protein
MRHGHPGTGSSPAAPSHGGGLPLRIRPLRDRLSSSSSHPKGLQTPTTTNHTPPRRPQVDGALGGRAGGAPGCELSLSGAAGLGRFTLLSPLRRQRVKPEGKLSAVLAPLRPSESALEPLEKRPGGCGATQRES